MSDIKYIHENSDYSELVPSKDSVKADKDEMSVTLKICCILLSINIFFVVVLAIKALFKFISNT